MTHVSIGTLSETLAANCPSGVVLSSRTADTDVPAQPCSDVTDDPVAVLPASDTGDNMLAEINSPRCDSGDCGSKEPEQKSYSHELVDVLDSSQAALLNSVSTVSEPQSSGVRLEQTYCLRMNSVDPVRRVPCVIGFGGQESVASVGNVGRHTSGRNRQQSGFATSARTAQHSTAFKLPKAKSEDACWEAQQSQYGKVEIGLQESSPASAVELSTFAVPSFSNRSSSSELSTVVSARNANTVDRLRRTATMDLTELKKIADGNPVASMGFSSPRQQSLSSFQCYLEDWVPQLVDLCCLSEPAKTCDSLELAMKSSRTRQVVPFSDDITEPQTLAFEHGSEGTVFSQQLRRLGDEMPLISFSFLNSGQRPDDVLPSAKEDAVFPASRTCSWKSVDIGMRVHRSFTGEVRQQSSVVTEVAACTKELNAVTNLAPQHENQIARFVGRLLVVLA